jgi:hypothetical protein
VPVVDALEQRVDRVFAAADETNNVHRS